MSDLLSILIEEEGIEDLEMAAMDSLQPSICSECHELGPWLESDARGVRCDCCGELAVKSLMAIIEDQ